MEFRKTSRVVLASLLVVGACFSTSASAHNRGHVTRDILLAPLLLPAAIIAASTPRPVVYQETYYVESHRHAGRHRHAPRHDARRHGGYRDHGGYRHYR